MLNQQQQSGPPGPPNLDMQVLPASSNSSNPLPHFRPALEELRQALQLPSSPQKRNQILQILRNNPQLTAAFIKERKLQQEQKRGGPSGPQGPPALFNMAMQVLPMSGNSSNQLPPDYQSLDQLMEMLQLSESSQQQDQRQHVQEQLTETLQQQPPNGPFNLQGPLAHFNMVMPMLPTSGNSSNQRPFHRQASQRPLESLLLSRSPQQDQQQQQHVQQLGDLTSPLELPAPLNMGVQVLPRTGYSSNPLSHHRLALQQLVQVFRLPSSPQTHDQILQVLRNNPQVMAALIKEKQLKQQRQHVQQRRHL